MAAPNIATASTIIGRTAILAVTTSPVAIITNAAASNKVLKVSALTVANVSVSTAARITADIFRSSTATRIAFEILVPVNASIGLIERGGSVYLEEGDTLRLTASANSILEAVVAYEDIS